MEQSRVSALAPLHLTTHPHANDRADLVTRRLPSPRGRRTRLVCRGPGARGRNPGAWFLRRYFPVSNAESSASWPAPATPAGQVNPSRSQFDGRASSCRAAQTPDPENLRREGGSATPPERVRASPCWVLLIKAHVRGLWVDHGHRQRFWSPC